MTLPADTLAGHRERFFKQFRALNKFYQSTSNMQYFKDLIAIPPLPEVNELELEIDRAVDLYRMKNQTEIVEKIVPTDVLLEV